MATVRLSKKFTLQIPDYVRGALLSAGTVGLVFVQEWLDKSDGIEFNWKLLFKIAIANFISYLIKNGVFEKAKIITTVDTNTKAENATEKIKEVV